MNSKYKIYRDDQIDVSDSKIFGDKFRFFNESVVGKQKYIPVNFVILDKSNNIAAGSIGGVIWGWLSSEQFWVKPEYRNQGLGTCLLEAIEKEATKNQIMNISHRAFTPEWTDFYLHRGYRVDGTLEERPPGHQFNFISKHLDKAPKDTKLPDGFTLILVDEARQNLLSELNKSIYKEFDDVLGDIPFKMFKTIVKDYDQLIAGISGYIGWGWLYISTLWVDPDYRGQNLANELMLSVEKEAIDFGVNKAFLGTTDFQAPGFYSKLGYQTFSVREDLPPGHKNYSMKKKLKYDVLT